MRSLIIIAAILVGVAIPAATELPQARHLPIIGQAAATEPFSPERFAEKIIASLGSLAFMGWLCHHMISKALPAKDAQLAAAQQSFNEESQKQRDGHREDVVELVKQLREQTDAVLEVVRSCGAGRAQIDGHKKA